MFKSTSETDNRALLDVIRRMASLAEHREGGTRNHLERVRGYCYVIARGLGLSSQEAEIISLASQLHDIGEVAISDEILSKSGQLTPAEWERVKDHPQQGAEILKGSPSVIVQAGEIMALTHHERWDGSGYPRGLSGEEIPLSGRICAVADVFDALTTPRPYKEEVPVDEALELIQESSGQLFDPQVVAAFSQRFDEIQRVRESHL